MEPSSDFNPMSLVSLALTSLAFGLVGHFLARDKGRNLWVWTILSLVPLLNIFCLAFLIGASSLRLERKLDAILARQAHDAARPTSPPSPSQPLV
jgi:hypothetical protein